jgi:hypothetical protein
MKKKNKDPIGDAFGLDPPEEPLVTLDNINVISKGTKEDAKEDYIKLRESLLSTVIRGNEIIDSVALEIKQGGSSAMMVQGMSQLLKTMTDASKAILDLHKEIRILDKDEEKPEATEKKTIKTNLNDIIDMAKEREKRMNG